MDTQPEVQTKDYGPEVIIDNHVLKKEGEDYELAKLRSMTADAMTHEAAEGEAMDAENDDTGVDTRSVYVGNVDYGSTPQELQEHFKECGTVTRVTIMVDKLSGHPKGYAYIEFGDPAAANNALLMADTVLRGRPIKVLPKRKNIAGYNRARGIAVKPRGRSAMFFPTPFGIPGMPYGFGRGTMYGPKFRGRGGLVKNRPSPY